VIAPGPELDAGHRVDALGAGRVEGELDVGGVHPAPFLLRAGQGRKLRALHGYRVAPERRVGVGDERRPGDERLVADVTRSAFEGSGGGQGAWHRVDEL